MFKSTIVFIFVLANCLFLNNSWSDGSHGAKLKINNNAGNKITIKTYNGKEDCVAVPHKVYYIGIGGTRTVKCHGQGKNKCGVVVIKTKGGDPSPCVKIKEGSKCVITQGTNTWSFGAFGGGSCNTNAS